MRKLFPEPARTYATQENALKLLESKKEAIAETKVPNFHYSMSITETGRFFVIVYITQEMMQIGLDHFYFINLGCCAKII